MPNFSCYLEKVLLLEQTYCILSLKNYYNINCRFDKVCINLQFIDISIFLQVSNKFFLVNTLEKYTYKLYNWNMKWFKLQ